MTQDNNEHSLAEHEQELFAFLEQDAAPVLLAYDDAIITSL